MYIGDYEQVGRGLWIDVLKNKNPLVAVDVSFMAGIPRHTAENTFAGAH